MCVSYSRFLIRLNFDSKSLFTRCVRTATLRDCVCVLESCKNTSDLVSVVNLSDSAKQHFIRFKRIYVVLSVEHTMRARVTGCVYAIRATHIAICMRMLCAGTEHELKKKIIQPNFPLCTQRTLPCGAVWYRVVCSCDCVCVCLCMRELHGCVSHLIINTHSMRTGLSSMKFENKSRRTMLTERARNFLGNWNIGAFDIY